MNTILSLILQMLINEPSDSAFYQISLVLLRYLDQLDELTVQKLADEAFTSGTVILKYCRRFGYKSFPAFKNQLKTTLLTRKWQLKNRYAKVDIKDIWNGLNSISVPYDQKALNEQLDWTALQMAESDLSFLVGAVFPMSLSLQFCEDCITSGLLVLPRPIEEGIQLNSGDHTLGILVTFSGRWLETNPVQFQKIKDQFDSSVVCTTKHYAALKHALLIPDEKNNLIPNTVYLHVLELLFLKIRHHLKK